VSVAAVCESAISAVPEESTDTVGGISVQWTRVGGAIGSIGTGTGSAVEEVAARTTAAASRSVIEMADIFLRHGRNENSGVVCEFKSSSLPYNFFIIGRLRSCQSLMGDQPSAISHQNLALTRLLNTFDGGVYDCIRSLIRGQGTISQSWSSAHSLMRERLTLSLPHLPPSLLPYWYPVQSPFVFYNNF